MIFIVAIIFFTIGCTVGIIAGVMAVTSSICVDLLNEKDFDRLVKSVEKRSKK